MIIPQDSDGPMRALEALGDAAENVFGLGIGSGFEDVTHELGGNAASSFAGDVSEELPAVHTTTER